MRLGTVVRRPLAELDVHPRFAGVAQEKGRFLVRASRLLPLDLIRQGGYEILANGLVVFSAFIPFFAIKELGRVLGREKLRALFFRRISATESDLSESKKG